MFLTFNVYIIEFIIPNLIWIYLNRFLVQNHLLNLCSSAVDSQILLRGQKAGVNVRIKAFWYTEDNLIVFTNK